MSTPDRSTFPARSTDSGDFSFAARGLVFACVDDGRRGLVVAEEEATLGCRRTMGPRRQLGSRLCRADSHTAQNRQYSRLNLGLGLLAARGGCLPRPPPARQAGC